MITKTILSFGFRRLKEYQPVTFEKTPVPVFKIGNGNYWVDCSVFHVLYEPMLVLVPFGIAVDAAVFQDTKIRIYDSRNPQKMTAELGVSLFKSIAEENANLCLFEVLEANLNLSFLKELYLKRIYNLSLKGPNFMSVYNFDIYKKLAALFSFPKQVWLVSIPSPSGNQHFPIDLCGIAGDTVIVGVRNSNKNMGNVNIGETFYISQAAASDYDKIYTLGKFSNNENPIEKIETAETAFPDVICDYRKLVLEQKLPFENQTIYVCKTAAIVKLNDKKPLFHLHKIWLLDGKKHLKVD